jgi:plastocyanin domain-containing protein
MNKTSLVIITLALVVGLGIIFMGGSKTDNNQSASTKPVQNVEVRDGIQYITIDAKGGYSPKMSSAKAGIPTKLIVKTNGTYDCSASLKIQAIGYQKVLAQTGEEIIDIGTPKAGVPLQALCSMGMYNFLINFS